MTDGQQNALSTLHRLLILVLSIIATAIDGIELSDLIYVAALILWLWAAFFLRIEAGVLDWCMAPKDPTKMRRGHREEVPKDERSDPIQETNRKHDNMTFKRNKQHETQAVSAPLPEQARRALEAISDRAFDMVTPPVALLQAVNDALKEPLIERQLQVRQGKERLEQAAALEFAQLYTEVDDLSFRDRLRGKLDNT